MFSNLYTISVDQIENQEMIYSKKSLDIETRILDGLSSSLREDSPARNIQEVKGSDGLAEEKKREIHIIYGNKAFEMTTKLLAQRDCFAGLDKHANIAIKPNLVLAKPSSSGATTEPEIVRAIVSHLQEKGFKNLSIIESAWLGEDTKRAYRVCGYEDIAAEFDIPIFDLKDDDTVICDDLSICKRALEAELLVNVPVLKAHCQTRLTCALKNMKGVIPDKEKRRYHQMGIHRPVASLNEKLGRQVVIVDGIRGDLTFEEGGTPVEMNRVFIAEDPVLIDAYAASLLGYRAEEIDYIAMAQELGVGEASLTNLRLVETNKAQDGTLVKDSAKLGQARLDFLTQRVRAEDACSACYGSLVHALERMSAKGTLPYRDCQLIIGQAFKKVDVPSNCLGIGSCTKECEHYVPGCPPRADEIVRFLCQYGKK